MYKTYREKVVLRDVTMHMERQQDLQRMLIWAVLLAAIASFFIGQMFVRRALRDLRYVTKKIEELHIDALQFEHSLDHLPEHDEIRTIAQALSTMA
jgi:methyl-accepting chemotaxis protein